MNADRRSFLKQTSLISGAAVLTWPVPSLLASPPGDTLRLGVIGCQRGRAVAKDFKEVGAKIVSVCDTDEARMDKLRKEVEAEKAVPDLRRILDDKSIDAVVIATPDHWHAPIAILACQTGKHVYVEKPCSHNIREGRLMIEAARRSGRVMQVGSQSRSTTPIREVIQLLREGAVGEILAAKAWNSQLRRNIGHEKPCEPPAGFDYDMWVGPAPMRPFRANCHHGTWRWWYDFGAGDIGNDGIHELDIAVWGLGVETHPEVISGHGSKTFFDDDQEFPDTQYVTYQFPAAPGAKPKLLIYEQRIWSPYVQEGHENGDAFYGTKGYLILGKENGWALYGPKNRLIREEKCKYSTIEHAQDFIDAVRSGRRPNADIEVGHRSATLCHLANILTRTGHGSLRFDPKTEKFSNDTQADALLHRTYREGHWAVPREA